MCIILFYNIKIPTRTFEVFILLLSAFRAHLNHILVDPANQIGFFFSVGVSKKKKNKEKHVYVHVENKPVILINIW